MKKLLTPTQLAEFLGIATQTIYNRHHLGKSLPPCIKLGRAIRFPIDGVETWLVERAEQPASPAPKRRGRPTKAEEIARRGGPQ